MGTLLEVNLFPGQPQRIAFGTLVTRLRDRMRGVDDHAVGIAFEEDAVRACWSRRDRKSGAMEAVAFAEETIPPDAIVDNAIMCAEPIVDALTTICGEFATQGLPERARAVVGISGHSVIVKRITLPTMTPEELRESIPWEAEQYIPFDINDVHIDVQVIRSLPDRGEMEVLLVAVRKDVVSERLAVVANAGLTPVIADVAELAIANAFSRLHQAPVGAEVILVDIGAGATTVHIIKDGVPVAFTRTISMGGALYVEEVQKQENVSDGDARAILLAVSSGGPATSAVQRVVRDVHEVIAGELQRSLDFYCATTVDARIDRIVLSGSVAVMPGLAGVIAARSGVRVERFAFPPAIAERVPVAAGWGPERFVIPFGLALRDVRRVRQSVRVEREREEKPTPQRDRRRPTATKRVVREQGVPCRRRGRPRARRGRRVDAYRPSQKEIAQFCDILNYLLRNGVPILDALELVATPDVVLGGSKGFRAAVAVVRARVAGGGSLTDGMAEAFSDIPLVLAVIQAGERCGEINSALRQVADRFRSA